MNRQDKNYDPETTSTESDTSSIEEEISEDHCQVLQQDKPAHQQLKLIVFEEAIVNAFGTCRQCGSKCTVYVEQRIGSVCNICISCHDNGSHDFIWSTGPITNRMPIFHLLFASGILCTGMESSKLLRLFEALNIPNIKQRELSNIMKSYVIPAVYSVWQKEQKSKLDGIAGKAIIVASDMWVDISGHSGLLGSGSTLDLDRNVVLDTQVIKVNKYTKNLIFLILYSIMLQFILGVY